MTHAATYPTRTGSPGKSPLAEAPAVLDDLILQLIGPAGCAPLRREEALDVLRGHLGRIQDRVQVAFENQQLSGLASARWLAALTDGLMHAIHAYALAMVPPRSP